jgi:hypothetical protein
MSKKLAFIRRTWLVTYFHGVVAAAALLSGCDHRTADIPTVSIQKVSPSGERVLVGGEAIEFDVQVLVHHVPTGSVGVLNVQAADGVVLGADGPKPLRNGEIVTFSVKIKVPETTSIEINTPVFFEGKTETDVLDSRQYKVVGRYEPK